jgi:hypothetical protein
MGAVTIALLIVLVGYVVYCLARVWDDVRRFVRMMAAGLTCALAAVISGMLARRDPSFLAFMAAASALAFLIIVAAFSRSQPR